MYSQFMPEIKSALERRNIKELDIAIKRLPLMDESILSAQHTFTQWTYERKALLTDLQAAVDAMDGPKLKGLLGEEGWTFEDEEDIVEEAREKPEAEGPARRGGLDLRGRGGHRGGGAGEVRVVHEAQEGPARDDGQEADRRDARVPRRLAVHRGRPGRRRRAHAARGPRGAGRAH